MSLLIGLLGGFFGSLVGLGGGVVMIPLMTSFLRFGQHMAHGTSLVAVVFTAFVGAMTYLSYGSVDWPAAAGLALSATVTARFGSLYAGSLPEDKLRKAFGAFMIFVSVTMLLKNYVPGIGDDLSFGTRMAIFILTGTVTGFLSGMMGVGGGTVMIPPMVLLAGMAQHTAQGTSLLAMVPVGITGAMTHYRLGNVKKEVVAGLVAGAVAGGYLGGIAAHMMPDLHLRFVFAAVLIYIGSKYMGVRLNRGKI